MSYPSARPSPTPSPPRRLNIGIGNFFFRYRNNVFPILFAAAVLVGRPQVVLGNAALDRVLIATGAVTALTGEAVRLITIGYEYIERGGKKGKVYASHLVQGGMYGLTRNPMYVGNVLIAVGISLFSGAPFAYFVVVPLFLFIYQAIVMTEENYLRGQFGKDYEDYCVRVPRFVPAFRGVRRAFGGMRYNWKRALRQDLSTIAALLLGLSLLPLWRKFFLRGFDAAKAIAFRTAVLSSLILACYAVLVVLKKQKRLHDAE